MTRQTWSTLTAATNTVSNTLGEAVPTRLSEALSDPISSQTCGMSRFQVRPRHAPFSRCAGVNSEDHSNCSAENLRSSSAL